MYLRYSHSAGRCATDAKDIQDIQPVQEHLKWHRMLIVRQVNHAPNMRSLHTELKLTLNI